MVGQANGNARNVTPLRRGTGCAILGITKENAGKRVLRGSSRIVKVGTVESLCANNEKITTTCPRANTVMSGRSAMAVGRDTWNNADSVYPEEALTRGPDTVHETLSTGETDEVGDGLDDNKADERTILPRS